MKKFRAWLLKEKIKKSLDKEMLSVLMGDNPSDDEALDRKLEELLTTDIPLDISDNGIRLPDGFSETLSKLSENVEPAV
jgi:glycerol-3-phosphate O-acyltransferase